MDLKQMKNKHQFFVKFWNNKKMVTLQPLQPKKRLEKRLKFMDNGRSGLHDVLGWTLLCSRVMGFFPVTGLLKTSDGLRCKFKSPYILFYSTTLIGQVIFSFMSIYWLFENGITLPNTTNALFYGSSLVTSGILAHMAWNWAKFMSTIEKIESTLPPFTRKIKKYCNTTTFIILILAIVEHILSLNYARAIATSCNPNDEEEMFFVYNMPWIFKFIPFHFSLGILFELFNTQSTFMWSFNDLLIIVTSNYLAEHFSIHFRLLKKALKEDNFSADIFRTQYLRIAKLVNLVNARFGIYVLTSFGCNLYWICTQLFYSLNKNNTGHIIAFDCDSKVINDTLHGMEHAIYFSFSFSFLVARTLLVLLSAARVNHTSTIPLKLLYEVPYDKYSFEVERFVNQITNMKIAISGLGFFYITRTMILTLLGSIITYELVLLQFNK